MLSIRDNLLLIRDATKIFRRCWTSLALWSLIFKTLSVALTAPLSAVLINRVIALSGNAAVSNYEIRTLLTNPLAITLIVTIVVVSIMIGVAEQSGQLLLAHATAHGEHLRVRDVFFRMTGKFIPILRLAIAIVAVALIVLLPVIGVIWLAFRQFLGTQDINYYLEARPAEFYQFAWIAALVASSAVVVLVGIALRLCLAIPGIAIHNRTAMESIRESWKLTRGKLGKLLSIFGIWFLFNFLITVFILLVLDVLEDFFFARVGDNVLEVAITIAVTLIARFATTVVISFFAGTTGVLLLQQLDARFSSRPEPSRTTATDLPASPAGTPPWYAQGRTIIAGMLMVAVASSATSLGVLFAVPDVDHVKVTAHRGDVTRGPENSLTAIRYAIELGSDYVEIDVQETADGEIVLSHDQDFLRVAGEPRKVWNMTLAEIKQLDIGASFSPNLAGERVPTLREVIEVTRDKIMLNIELKPTREQPQLTDRVVQLIQAEGFQQQCVISSLDLSSLQRVRELDPSIRLVANISASVGNLSKLKVDALSMNQNNLDRAAIERFQGRGFEVHVWTVNDRSSMQRFIELGVDNILTDKPAELLDLIREMEALDPIHRALLRFRVILST